MFVMGNGLSDRIWSFKMHSTFDIHFTVYDTILVFYEALSICDLDNSALSSFILQYLYTIIIGKQIYTWSK